MVPVYNEVTNVKTLLEEIDSAMSSLEIPWMCVWVDDGSTDGTGILLAELCAARSNHNLLSSERNRGQSAALAAGFRFSRTPLVAMMDGDGQSDPKDLRRMIDLILLQDFDVVGGIRTNRENIVRLLASKIANAFRNAVTGDGVRDVGCSLRVMRSEYIAGIPVFRGFHRFLPTLIRLNGGTNQHVIPVHHRRRMGGYSKYGIWNRLWIGIADTLAVRWWSKRMVGKDVGGFISVGGERIKRD